MNALEAFNEIAPHGMALHSHVVDGQKVSIRWRDANPGRAIIMARSNRPNLDSLRGQIDRGIAFLHAHDISVGDVIVHSGSSGLESLESRSDIEMLQEALAEAHGRAVWWARADRVSRSPEAREFLEKLFEEGVMIGLASALFNPAKEGDGISLRLVASLELHDAGQVVARMARGRKLRAILPPPS